MSEAPPDPLILTVALDPDLQAVFDRLRTRHFPPARNYLSAHVTMFHHLPAERSDQVRQTLATHAATLPSTPVAVTGLRFLGRGVAFNLHMPTLVSLRRTLAAGWSDCLTRQDRQAWSPHVTIQNKVDPAVARQTRDTLQAGFQPFGGVARGLDLWIYRGGPWEHAAQFMFNATQPAGKAD